MPCEDVEIELRRYPELAAVIQDRVNQSGMIKNRIAGFDIAQKVDERNLIASRARQRAHDEVEIGCGEPRPTIRTNHRDFIMRDDRAYGKSDYALDPFSRVPVFLIQICAHLRPN